MKKNVGIPISKCLKSAAKNRRADQTARAILTAPTVCVNTRCSAWCFCCNTHDPGRYVCTLEVFCLVFAVALMILAGMCVH